MSAVINTDYIDYAVSYAARGLRVFALQPKGKIPATPNGCKDGTLSPVLIRQQWSDRSRNIGIATGVESGVFVLDVDGPEGAQSLTQWVDLHGAFPATPQAITARGRHFYFSHPGELCELKNSASKAAPGIDVRTDGGYVVAPPSIHPSGDVYRWADGAGPADVPFAACPDWLLRKLVDATKHSPAPRDHIAPRSVEGHTRYGLRALDTECMELARAPEGGRNHKLNTVAFRIGQLVAAGHLVEAHAVNDLRRAAQAARLEERETERTIESGLTAGLASPNPSDPDPNERRNQATRQQRAAEPRDPQATDSAPAPKTRQEQARDAAEQIAARSVLSAPEVAYCALVHLTDQRRATMARTGFKKLDDAIGGYPEGTMHVIGGRTGAGKSSLLLAQALNITKRGKQVGIVSLEDAEWLWGARLICSLQNVNPEEFFNAHPSEESVRMCTMAIKEAERYGLHFAFPIGKPIEVVAARVRELIARRCEVIGVDYLQAVMAKGAERYIARTDAAQELKGLCHDAGAALVLLSQLKRAEQGKQFKEPSNDDLKDSGDIENMAESITLLWPTSDKENAEVVGKVTKVKWSAKRPRFAVERNPVSGCLTALVDAPTDEAPQQAPRRNGFLPRDYGHSERSGS